MDFERKLEFQIVFPRNRTRHDVTLWYYLLNYCAAPYTFYMIVSILLFFIFFMIIDVFYYIVIGLLMIKGVLIVGVDFL